MLVEGLLTSCKRILTIPFVLFGGKFVDVDGGVYTATTIDFPLVVVWGLIITLECFKDDNEIIELSESELNEPLERFASLFAIEMLTGFL